MIIQKLTAAGREVATTLCDAGFGLPFMAAQYLARIEGRALAAVEALARAKGGFTRVMHDLNQAQIEVAKIVLGLPVGAKI